jgi:hypothetical protein
MSCKGFLEEEEDFLIDFLIDFFVGEDRDRFGLAL